MILRSILLQHFRSYTQEKFDFSDTMTVIVGPNTAGKTNLAEAISLLCIGKSFKTSSDTNMIAFGQDVARVQGLFTQAEPGISNFKFPISNIKYEGMTGVDKPREDERIKAEVVIAKGEVAGGRFSKRFTLNGVAKSRASFATQLPIVLFRPEELEIVIDGPSLRRAFLDEVLEQVDKDYARSLLLYQKALRQRNALLDSARENGYRNAAQFEYWDNLLIENGQVVTQKREEFIEFINMADKEIFALQLVYDHSKVSRERLEQYKDAEVGAGNTLVGPHRDDFSITMEVPSPQPRFNRGRPSPIRQLAKGEGDPGNVFLKEVRHFGSRGQQRLVVLQLKLLQIAYIEKKLSLLPLLVLDDIFSELDSGHITLVLDRVKGCQIILTTTHKEFVLPTKDFAMIELGK